MSYKYGIHVNSNMEIGTGLRIVHADGVYLNCRSIGKNFTVYQNVTLGSKEGVESEENSVPVVENGVTVYAGAVVVGSITLHEGCIIGANVYVNKDVPEKAIVAGNPARIIKYKL